MIDYIKYTLDGKTYNLFLNSDGTWSRDEFAPNVAGNYQLTFTISENGIITTIDSSNSLYETYLQVVADTERVAYLETLVPDFIAEIPEFAKLYKIENEALDTLYADINQVKNDAFIKSASNYSINRLESFMNIKGAGTLNQRKSYLITMLQKGNKLSEKLIKEIANTITGSDCVVTFIGSDELVNPEPGYGLLRVQVLSPDSSKNYRYDDIVRALKPLVPGHIKLFVIKYYSTWADVINNFNSWNTVKSYDNWSQVKNYLPPQ
ncbi:MAG: hypothetical protein K0S41_476 [Anaerocolumna sp.]|jgi:hypothetical protein|nr:hypothetical protein [Anaerocolumna sp.]